LLIAATGAGRSWFGVESQQSGDVAFEKQVTTHDEKVFWMQGQAIQPQSS
jgi:hypothetical protein